MRSYQVAALLVLGSASLVMGHAAAEDARTRTANDPQLPDFRPGLDDLMTMLVQPRHIKLHASAEAKNWELAAFQLRELRSSFRRISQYLPQYRGKDVDQTIASTMAPVLSSLEAAIKAKDSAKFRTSYESLTSSCNACHSIMEHAFLVVKVPGSSASIYPDQEFTPGTYPGNSPDK